MLTRCPDTICPAMMACSRSERPSPTYIDATAGDVESGCGTKRPMCAVFRPVAADKEGDLVWIGNWGDDERTAELHEFLIQPVKELGLKARIHGVRYPEHARQALGIRRHRIRGLGAEFRSAADLCALSSDGPRSSPAVRDRSCRAFRRSESSKRSRAACRSFLRRGPTRRACSRPERISSSQRTATKCRAA